MVYPPSRMIIRKLRILCVSGFPDCAHDLSAAGLFGVGALDEQRRFAWKAAVSRDAARAMSSAGTPSEKKRRSSAGRREERRLRAGCSGRSLRADGVHPHRKRLWVDRVV